MRKKRIIIVGGGFGGLNLAKGLMHSNFEVILLDKKNHHLFQPLLYQVAAAALSPADIAVPIREVLSDAENIKVYMQEVIAINKEEKVVKCLSGDEYYFDRLILAPGSVPFYFGNEQWKKNAPGLKTIADALNIRDRILKSFEKSELNKEQRLNFVIIGGGPTGVELAGAFAEIAYDILLNDFRDFDPSLSKVYLVEGGEEVLPSYSGKLSKQAKKYLVQLGVEILLGNRVSDILVDHIVIDGKKIFSDNIIWAAGNKTSPLIENLGVEVDRMGRVKVEDDLSVKGFSDIYVIGDSALVVDAKGKPLPSLAPVASQQGKFLAKQFRNNKKDKFNYLDKGTMATIGKFKAVMQWKRLRWSGTFAWFAWGIVHVLFLIRFRNKLAVFLQWVWSFFWNKRGVRLIK